MPLDQFIEMVKRALPEDVRPEELLGAAPNDMWRDDPYGAMCHALRACTRLNWEAYLERNADVKAAQVDACQHYIRHGIYEGRRLISWHGMKQPEEQGCPVVSVVLTNHNNAYLLVKSLESVVTQTLKAIEIVFVDDCSTDGSLHVARKYADNDDRIKIIVNDICYGSLLTRKRGVMAASGRYVILLDSFDVLEADVCEIAARTMALGYDMVRFDDSLYGSVYIKQIDESNHVTNKNIETEEYFYGEILSKLLVDWQKNDSMGNNVYLREIAVAGLSSLPDNYIMEYKYMLEELAIIKYIRNLCIIKNKYYKRRLTKPVKFETAKDMIFTNIYDKCKTVACIKQFIKENQLNISLERFYIELCNSIIIGFIKNSHNCEISKMFWDSTKILGFDSCLKALIKFYPDRINEIINLSRREIDIRSVRHIGIFYPVLGPGGVEMVIHTLCGIFENTGYKISIFTEEKTEHDLIFPAWVNIIYITPVFQGDANLLERMLGFEKAVSNSGIDIMLHASTWRSHIAWDLLVLHRYNIPIIITWHATFGFPLIGHFGHNLQTLEAIFRSVSAVTCLSVADELYLRLRGINAIYLPNPIKQIPYNPPSEIPAKIAVVGRFGADEKQAGQSLKVMKEVVKQAPWISMILIGDFYNDQQREEFRIRIKRYGLEENVSLTGWVDDTNFFLRQCGVLLSVAYWEAFPMGIAEAQAIGLPCVIYDLCIEQGRNNPSIIKVPQGDFRAAASEVVRVLGDREEWRKLSFIAVENARQYSPEVFAANLKWLLANFQKCMPIRKYGHEDYQTVAKIVSCYGSHKKPEVWDNYEII